MSQQDDYRDLIRRLSENPEWVDALMELFLAANRFSRVHNQWRDPHAETFVDTFADRATARANDPQEEHV
jgi:hypothetical protein